MHIGNFGFSMVRRRSPQVLGFGLWERKPMPEKSWLQVLNFCSDNRKSQIQNRKWLGLSVIAFVLVAAGAVAQAQQPKKVSRIAYFSAGSAASQASRLDVFRQGLWELGYAEGKDIIIEQRYAEGKLDRVAALAAELVGLKLNVIVTGGPAATRSAKEATTTIPIVMGFDYDPVGSGVVASLARPGGNITGLSSLAPEISGKQLELLKEVLPRLSRVAVLGNSTEPGIGQLRKEAELVAAALKVQLQYLDILAPKDIGTAFEAATKGRAEAVLALSSFIIISQRTQIAELATKNRLPAIYPWPEFVEDGGLMTYGANSNDLFRRAATYVDKILKGAKPADLPVEQPKKFEFIVNLKAAKQIGLTIPPNVLVRADRVIK
jgi:putative tryptophan/tyrosine transport system substrate-binding protein